MQAEPLPFFKQTPDGLQRAVKVSIDSLESGEEPAELAWNSKGKSGTQKLQLHFGENQQVMMTVPDVDQVELSLRAGQHEIKLPLTLPPAKKWQVYIVPTAHTDIGYTDLQERVEVRHANNGLTVLQWLEEYPSFKWYSETYWQLNALLAVSPGKDRGSFRATAPKAVGLVRGLCQHAHRALLKRSARPAHAGCA